MRKLFLRARNHVHHVRLQWGRNFIVAETLATQFLDNIIDVLQWGRNFIVAETDKRRHAGLRAGHASMGPQLYRCGNPPDRRLLLVSPPGFNGAATLSLRKQSMLDQKNLGIFTLQWGRNFIVAETGQTHQHLTWQRLSPNGAATLSLRKQRIRIISMWTARLLQGGRNFIVAETPKLTHSSGHNDPITWSEKLQVSVML